MYKNRLDILNKITLFQGISKEELSVLIDCIKPRLCNYKRNDGISIAGEKIEGIGIILSGKVVVTKENANGDRIILTILKQGEIFGEIAVFSGQGVWPATVYAQEMCTVMFWSPEKIIGNCEKLCMCHRTLILNMLKIISLQSLMLNKKVEYLVIKSLREKICRFLYEQNKLTGKLTFTLPMNRNEMADFINVSRPALSREMSRMRDEGIIQFQRSEIQIKNLEALKNIINEV